MRAIPQRHLHKGVARPALTPFCLSSASLHHCPCLTAATTEARCQVSHTGLLPFGRLDQPSASREDPVGLGQRPTSLNFFETSPSWAKLCPPGLGGF